MNKSSLRVQALALRRSGFGINEITLKLGVRKNTVSLWCRPLPLTENQKFLLKERSKKKGLKRHKIAMRERVRVNLQKLREIENRASLEVGKLSKRELFLSGIMLYWAEGFKHKRESALGFANSDPRLVQFYLLWLTRCLKIKKKDLRLRVTVNVFLKDTTGRFEEFWSKFLGIPKTQFAKPFFQNSIQKKIYAADKEYYGVLRVYVKKSSFLFKKMRGWIIGLSRVA